MNMTPEHLILPVRGHRAGERRFCFRDSNGQNLERLTHPGEEG